MKKMLPVLLVLAQVMGSNGMEIEGLGLAMVLGMVEDVAISSLISMISVLMIGCLWFGVLWVMFRLCKWIGLECNFRIRQGKSRAEASCQADLGMSPREREFMREYQSRVEFLTDAVREESREREQCEQALIEV